MSVSAGGGRKADVPARKAAQSAYRGARTGLFQGKGHLAQFLDRQGNVDIDEVIGAFRLTRSQLAETAGLAAATISKSDRREGARAQNRMREVIEILEHIREWAGSNAQALAWYRAEPIAALDGRTAEALVKSGEAGAVRDYLDHLALGGFA
jgi:uncharacterized protein (DUF2384 family)